MGDAGAGGGCDGHPAGQQVFVELGAAGDGEQRRLIVSRELLRVGRDGRCCDFDGFQGGEHIPGSGVPRVGTSANWSTVRSIRVNKAPSTSNSPLDLRLRRRR
ncbi:hypothetical protein AB0941_37010 [Streptomyces sp. NPDC013433]|uniref:hypothetical protein n=1 Tax=Streptomyces sp. NPDC013433 TaxID=3155604 RepID=UPI0034526929